MFLFGHEVTLKLKNKRRKKFNRDVDQSVFSFVTFYVCEKLFNVVQHLDLNDKTNESWQTAIDPSKHRRHQPRLLNVSLIACNVRVLTRELIRQRGNRDARTRTTHINYIRKFLRGNDINAGAGSGAKVSRRHATDSPRGYRVSWGQTARQPRHGELTWLKYNLKLEGTPRKWCVTSQTCRRETSTVVVPERYAWQRLSNFHPTLSARRYQGGGGGWSLVVARRVASFFSSRRETPTRSFAQLDYTAWMVNCSG